MLKNRSKTTGTLSGVDALRYLADIESRGIEFYAAMEGGAASEEVRKLAGALKEAEKRHYAQFTKFADKLLARADSVASTTRLSSRVRSIMQTPVFANKDQISESSKYLSDAEVLRLSIRAEETTVVILIELQTYVLEEHRPYMARVIKEERKHANQLEQLLQELSV